MSVCPRSRQHISCLLKRFVHRYQTTGEDHTAFRPFQTDLTLNHTNLNYEATGQTWDETQRNLGFAVWIGVVGEGSVRFTAMFSIWTK